MELLFISRIYPHPDPEITLRDVWWFAEDELNAVGQLTEELIESDDDLTRLHRTVSWLSQAIIEFVDLLGLHFPRSGRWTHTNYLFYEAMSALRESIIIGLNGSTRASLSTLRSSMEMFLFHCWWQERLFLKKNFEPFYDWLEGKKPTPPFKNIVQDNFRSFHLPKSDLTFDKVFDTYRALCSYVHAPLLRESITTISGSIRPGASQPLVKYWMEMMQITLRIVLEQLIFHKPQSLFPVDINRKFAFSPPVGMFFDNLNSVPLRAALGEEMMDTYRTAAKEIQLVKDVMNFYQSHPDLSDEQISRMWDEEDQGEFGKDVPNDMQSRWVLVKARMRVANMALSYMATEKARALSL